MIVIFQLVFTKLHILKSNTCRLCLLLGLPWSNIWIHLSLTLFTMLINFLIELGWALVIRFIMQINLLIILEHGWLYEFGRLCLLCNHTFNIRTAIVQLNHMLIGLIIIVRIKHAYDRLWRIDMTLQILNLLTKLLALPVLVQIQWS